VTQRLQVFCSEDLGGFWLDILKDRLYTASASGRARRSAQSALYHVTQMLLRLMAPVLSFTAEEAWAVLHPGKAGQAQDSVFFHTWNGVLPEQEGEAALLARWKRIREIRAEVTKKLEEVRATGAIGSSLQANVAVTAGGEDQALLASLGNDLKYVFITSSAALKAGEAGPVEVAVAPSADPKCERCWHWRADVGSVPRYAAICARCAATLDGHEETRRHA